MLLAAEENADEAGGPGLATGRPDRLPRKPASPIRRADHIGDSITTTALPWTRKRMSHASSAGERWVERCSASDSMADCHSRHHSAVAAALFREHWTDCPVGPPEAARRSTRRSRPLSHKWPRPIVSGAFRESMVSC